MRLALLPIAATAVLLAGCSTVPDTSIRALLDKPEENQQVVSWDDADVQEAVTRVAGLYLAEARANGWSRVSTDRMNEAELDSTIVAADRNVNEIAGGTEAVSIDLDKRVLAIGGQDGSCWVMHVTGTATAPDYRYAAFFAPLCHAKAALETDLVFTPDWPARPTPTEEGKNSNGASNPQSWIH